MTCPRLELDVYSTHFIVYSIHFSFCQAALLRKFAGPAIIVSMAIAGLCALLSCLIYAEFSSDWPVAEVAIHSSV